MRASADASSIEPWSTGPHERAVTMQAVGFGFGARNFPGPLRERRQPEAAALADLTLGNELPKIESLRGSGFASADLVAA